MYWYNPVKRKDRREKAKHTVKIKHFSFISLDTNYCKHQFVNILGRCLNKKATRDAIHIPQVKAVQRKSKYSLDRSRDAGENHTL